MSMGLMVSKKKYMYLHRMQASVIYMYQLFKNQNDKEHKAKKY